MLVVFDTVPGAAPDEAVLCEETVAEVALHNLVGKVSGTVDVGLAIGGLDNHCAVFPVTDVGVVERVDVYCQSSGMIGEFFGAGHRAVAKAAGVVVAHLAFVVGIVFIWQAHALDRVVVLVELTEDIDELFGNELVADHLTMTSLTVLIPVQQSQVSQVGAFYVGILHIGLTLHLLPDGVRDLHRNKVLPIEAGHVEGEG